VGFSTASAKYLSSNDSSVAKDNLKALQLFFIRYHDFRKNDFYIAGESYAGIYIPRLAEEILDYNEGIQETRINLRGILIGNACTHPYECTTSAYYSRFTSDFLYTRGFLEETQYNLYKTNCLTN
jgi:serine carboxypeptidase-like clade 2